MSNPETDPFKRKMAERSAFVRDWCTAFHRYRAEHSSQFPSSFEQAKPYLEPQSEPKRGLSPNSFEIVYRGLWTAMQRPNEVILLKERAPWKASEGKWVKVYGMADGSAVGLTLDDARAFETWEQEHTS